MEFLIAVAIFLIMALSPFLIKKIDFISIINILGTILLIALFFNVFVEAYSKNYLTFLNGVIYIDSLSLIQLFIIISVTLIASIYSYKYIKEELSEGKINLRKARVYYFLFTMFVFSMIFLCISNNIMGMWIGLEATTLSTAFLIGFNSNKLSLEAAWKYIIICSIGIGIGLIGIILFIYSAGGQAGSRFLSWTYLVEHYRALNKDIVKVAFTFIFIGIGTKAGIAPMHTWLSDGHSEAPSPISAMMSGVLLNLAIYVILRFYIVIKHVGGIQNLRYLFIVFGCISLIVSGLSILKQSNYKRLLAFSSVENIGIITLGFGFGGTLGTIGALLHGVIHAYGKTLLFLVSGNILSAYKTKRIDKISGLVKTMPANAVFFVFGLLVITGAPPFASFFSEFKILIAGIEKGYYVSVAIYSFCLLLVLAGFLKMVVKMVFETEKIDYTRLEKDKQNILPLYISFGFIIAVSALFSNFLYPVLVKAAAIIGG